MTKIIDPYGSELVKDYERIIKQFGLEGFKVEDFPNPNRLMRRGVVFSGRDLKRISEAIKKKKPFYVLSGIMPTSEKIHFGTKSVVENIRYFQDNGGHAYILVADLEAASARGVSLEEGRERALKFHIPAYVALGLDPKKTTFYFQSENREVMNKGYEFAKKITLNEFKAIYGNADPGRIMAAVTQVADILYPQFKTRMPGIIPVGIDQDPHIRLSRDVVRRTKKDKYFLPSSLYHKYTPSLDGSMKMSKSNPMSCLSLPESRKEFEPKLKRALSGGRETLEEHRRLGAKVEEDMCFELLKQHLIEDDKELDQIHYQYKKGLMTSGEIKQLAIEKMDTFMQTFEKKLKDARKKVGKLTFVK